MPQSSTGSSSSASGFIRNGVRSDCKCEMPSRSVRTNESSKSHFCHLLPLGKLVSNSHSPEYCYTACTSHEPILMYDVCNDWICVRGWRRNDSWLCYTYICSDKWNSRTPIENAELELFVDGSAQVIEGNRRAGYAVTCTTEVVASGRLPDHFSAQAAELVALTRACTLASGSVANIYTDSRYAFGVIHDFGVIWQTRKFLTSAGSPIKHAGLVKDLMFAMNLPKKLAVIKVKAHLTTNTTEAKGNALADVAAKQACSYATVQCVQVVQHRRQFCLLNQSLICTKMFLYMKHGTWLDKGATVDSSGCWTKGGKYVAPESLLPYLAQQIHSLGHSGPATMNHRFSNQWWNPKFRNAATETVKRCVTCQKNNDVPAATTPAAHTPAPPGPFRHLQVDYISLPPL